MSFLHNRRTRPRSYWLRRGIQIRQQAPSQPLQLGCVRGDSVSPPLIVSLQQAIKLLFPDPERDCERFPDPAYPHPPSLVGNF